MISKLSFLGMSQFKVGMTISIIISVFILIYYLLQYFRAKLWQDWFTIARCKRKLVSNFEPILLNIWIVPMLIAKGIFPEKIGLALAFVSIPIFFLIGLDEPQ